MSDLESSDLPRFADLDAEYEILQELGRGGTAVVYLARERELGRRVAIKVIRATYIEDEEAAARLVREAHTVASLQHPNIVMLHGTRRLRDHSLALIMQYVPGRTLKAEVRALGPLPFDRIERILTDLGRALSCAQRHRIVHRDIKPENVYLDEEAGIARLSDFGVARPWDSDQGLTLPGMAIGTPAYMSPEQIDGGMLDGRSDLYSLGLVGYELLTGRTPWAGENLFGMIYKQKHEVLPPLEEVRPGIPPLMCAALERLMRKNRDERWADADEFLVALSGKPVPERRPTVEGEASAVSVTASQEDSHTIQYWRADVPPSALTTQDVIDILALPSHPSIEEEDEDAALVVSAEAPGRNRRRAIVLAGIVPLILLSTALIRGMTTRDAANLLSAAVPTATRASASPDSVIEQLGAAAGDARPALAWALHGNHQTGMAGDTLPKPLTVQVEDAARRPVAGVAVKFAVTAGDGLVEPSTVVTDGTGSARARWLLRGVGAHEVSATVAEFSHAVTFNARAQPRSNTHMAAVSPTELQATLGAALGSPLVVRVVDDRGEPVAGAQVVFTVRTGDGRISPATSVTGKDGTAKSEWVLGPSGAQEVVATLSNVPAARTVFRATARPTGLPVRRGVVLGGTHTCSLNGEGQAECWGGNDKGQLGDGFAGRRDRSVRVAAPEPFAALSPGVSHTCGVAVSGGVLCWGANAAGQLGDGSRVDRSLPVKLATDEQITRVFTGITHSCGLDAAGRLFCWGQNAHGQLGDGTRTDRTAPVAAASGRTFRAVSIGWAHTCGVASDGATYCWGRNASGELGDGSTIGRTEPTPVAGGYRFTSLESGSAHTCGITSAGTVLCWGQNTFGQLGSEGTENSSVPVPVLPSDFFTAIALGSVHSCALARDRSARCWGRNTYGQLGDGTVEDRPWPTPVTGGHRFNALYASGAHTCGSSDGATYCWGYNSDGQLGNGTRTNQTRPVAVTRQ